MLTIHRAAVSHLPAILTTLERCVDSMNRNGIVQWDSHYPSADRIAKDIHGGGLFIVEMQGVVAAAVVVDAQPDPEYSDVIWQFDEESAGIVHRLMVRPEFQRQGLGRRMMEHAHDEARRLGYASIRLDAYTGNPAALALYEALGYSSVGTMVLRRGVFKCFEKDLRREAPGPASRRGVR